MVNVRHGTSKRAERYQCSSPQLHIFGSTRALSTINATCIAVWMHPWAFECPRWGYQVHILRKSKSGSRQSVGQKRASLAFSRSRASPLSLSRWLPTAWKLTKGLVGAQYKKPERCMGRKSEIVFQWHKKRGRPKVSYGCIIPLTATEQSWVPKTVIDPSTLNAVRTDGILSPLRVTLQQRTYNKYFSL